MIGIDLEDEPSICTAQEMSLIMVALEAYQQALRAEGRVDREAFLAQYPEIAGPLVGYLEALDLIQSVAGETTSDCGPVLERPPLGFGDILGEFRIIREIGRGGMGVVYEAEQLGLSGRRVALKVLPVSSTHEARSLQRFHIETQAAACLNHPNIVPVFSAGLENGIPFYAMPLIKGRSLAEVLRTLRGDGRESTPISAARGIEGGPEVPWHVVVARLGLQAAEALEHAHSLGVIHRDIKPSNLIIDAEWRLWVTDFGLARIACDETGPTSTGDLVGTLRYMSPEQIRGEPGAGDARGDIYALGVTLYEAITLRPLFKPCDRSGLIHQILNHEPTPPRALDPAVPKDLETIVLKAMDKLPVGRFATARDLADDLRRLLEDRPIRARRLGLVERSRRWSGRHRASLATALAGILLAMGIGTMTLWRAKQQADADLLSVRAAQNQERLTLENLLLVNDTITIPLLESARAVGTWDEGRIRQSYEQLIFFYDQIAKPDAPDDHQVEVVAKAVRRAGALRMALGSRRGLDNYARAVGLYEEMTAKAPDRIWYRTGLLSTLREYASQLDRLGDRRVATVRRRACEIAQGLLADPETRLSCYRKGAVPEFDELARMLSDGPGATAADRALAARMRTWIEENPEPAVAVIQPR